jgi:hypothetical protein
MRKNAPSAEAPNSKKPWVPSASAWEALQVPLPAQADLVAPPVKPFNHTPKKDRTLTTLRPFSLSVSVQTAIPAVASPL